MIRARAILCFSFLAAALHGQNVVQQSPVPKGISVEVIGSKIYKPDEVLKFKVLLMNRGTASVYVSKSFTEVRRGQAGFKVYVKQLSGGPSQYICDPVPDEPKPLRLFDQRTAYEILRDDFVLLAPGTFVGSEVMPEGCPVRPSGTYEATGVYLPADAPSPNVQNVTVAQIRMESKAFKFSVQQSSPRRERK